MGDRRRPKGIESPIPVGDNWERSPEWVRTIERVQACKARGMDERQITTLMGIDIHAVRRIIEDDIHTQKIAVEGFNARIEIAKSVMGLGLDIMLKRMKELHRNDELRDDLLGSVKSMKTFTDMLTALNTIVRLEEGKATSHIASETRTVEDTQAAVAQLKDVDVIFTPSKVDDSGL